MTRSQLHRQQVAMGEFDPMELLSVIGGTAGTVLAPYLANQYSTIEIRTTLSPPVLMNVADLLNGMNAPPNAVSKFLKPTVILTEKSGKQNVIAPYGVAHGGSAAPAVLTLLGIFGVVFIAGRLSAHL